MLLNKKKPLIQICQEWYQNKLNNPLNPINPLTEYTVKQNGPKYRELEKLCKTVKIIINDTDIPVINKKTVLGQPLTDALCEKWMKDKFKNPISNYTIRPTAAIYKELAAECPHILELAKKQNYKDSLFNFFPIILKAFVSRNVKNIIHLQGQTF